jgi:hypothetical protein
VPQNPAAGEKVAATQPFSPLPNFRADRNENNMWGLTPLDQLWCRVEFKKMRYDGHFTPPMPGGGGTGESKSSWGGTFQYPGIAGGFNWGSVSVDADNGLLVAAPMLMATASCCAALKTGPRRRPSSGHAARLRRPNVESRQASRLALRAVCRRRAIRKSRRVVRKLAAAKVDRVDPESGRPRRRRARPALRPEQGALYRRHDALHVGLEAAASLPECGNGSTVLCASLRPDRRHRPQHQEAALEACDRDDEDLRAIRPRYGSAAHGGHASAGRFDVDTLGLIFHGGAMDNTIRAFDLRTGKEKWEAELPGSAHATPMSYLSAKGNSSW